MQQSNITKRIGSAMISLLVLCSIFAGTANAKDTASKATACNRASAAVTKETAEMAYTLSTSKDVVMNLLGTTPIKDWKMTAHGLAGSAKMVLSASNSLTEIRSLDFKLPVYNLKGEARGMDEDAYEALKADRHKEITFKMISANVTQQNANAYTVAAKGILTVAGVAKEVTLRMASVVGRDGSVTFTGSQVIRMSDYNVERPTLLFGTIKAGDELTLTYKLIFNR
jgi:hypothetical protein